MLRRLLLALSESPRARALVLGNPLSRRASRRFVAGETLDETLAVADGLSERGFLVSLNLLGERTRTAAEAEASAAAYLEIADRLGARPIDCYISVKLTQLGLDVSTDLAAAQLRRILEAARIRGRFVRVDMEHSIYVDRTLEIITGLRREGYTELGAVIQAYLRRSADDLDRLLALGVPVRLCKGAYMEPPSVAFPRKRDVDASYARLMERLLRHPAHHAIATHDERLIRAALDLARREGIGPHRFEFQMIYGIRRQLQEQIRSEGHRMRIYVPYGEQWYPYLMRRLAERPANLAFMLRNLLRR